LDKKHFERVNLKSSIEFVNMLNSYIVHLNNKGFSATDINIGKYEIKKTVVSEKYNSFQRLPALKRLDETVKELSFYLFYKYRHEVSTKERKEIQRSVYGMFLSLNISTLYRYFYKWTGRPELFKMASKGRWEYLDIFSLAYLKICIEGVISFKNVKHLLIDEMQDYTPIQYAIIAKTFHCKMTFLGDFNQSLNPCIKNDTEGIIKIFPYAESVKLNNSYRSTFEIINFAQKILYNKNLIAIERHGEKPEIISLKNMDEEIIQIAEIIVNFNREKKHNSLAVICKNNNDTNLLFDRLKEQNLSVHLLDSNCGTFLNGIVLTDAYLSKGLEFDAVIIPFVSENNYKNEMDKSMLYIACTRAMHRLYITCTGKKSSFLND
jgi:DNA helicase-2/ATP-dependent DNA helicase PcrA